MVETDWFLGRFAARFLPDLDDRQLDQFEALLLEGDNDIFNWVTGRTPIPPGHDNALMKFLVDFNNRR